jgi:hypothetical protein
MDDGYDQRGRHAAPKAGGGLRVVQALLLLALLAPALAPGQVLQHGRFERSFEASAEYADPVRDVALAVEFTGPGGRRQEVPGFWDGGRRWKVRFSPEATGKWSFRTRASNAADSGLHQQGGSFEVNAYQGGNLLYRDGAPRLSQNRRYFVQANGRPWFWLACTGWNSALLSTREEWQRYLGDRAAKKFTAIQFVMTQWRAGRQDELGQVAFTGTEKIVINPKFFARLDEKFDQLNDAGLVALPVLLWALTSRDKESPGESLSDDQAILLAKYMVARYGAHHVIWILGGDGDYRAEKAARWKTIGRAVFPPGRSHRPVTLHPRGMQDPWPEFKDEDWVQLFIYQSGHGSDARKWKWNATHGPADGWKIEPPRPVIDSEPNYERHISYQDKKLISDTEVRRAAYYSLLSAPPAGVTYGAHGIWYWARKEEVPLDHPRTGAAEPWWKCLDYPGAQQMKHLKQFFDSIEWWKLRPDRLLMAEDPPDPGFRNYPMPACSEDNRFAVIYLPGNPKGKLNLSKFATQVSATWIDPRTGERRGSTQWKPSPSVEWQTPGEGDWLLLLELASAGSR